MTLKTYNSFIIKNNKFIDNYDEMYQKSTDVPWQQDQISNLLDVKMFRYKLANYFQQENIKINGMCELGCGLGFFLDYISILANKSYGIDVSTTAIRKATKTFPKIKFGCFDIRRKIKSENIFDKTSFDMTVERGTLWYVIEEYEMFIENMITMSNKYICFHQNFRHLKNKYFIGHEIFPTPASFVNYLQNKMNVLWVDEYTNYQKKNYWVTVFAMK